MGTAKATSAVATARHNRAAVHRRCLLAFG
jgi:hypothetical protein